MNGDTSLDALMVPSNKALNRTKTLLDRFIIDDDDDDDDDDDSAAPSASTALWKGRRSSVPGEYLVS